MIFFNFNYWATLSSKIMSNFLIVIHYMYFQNTMVSFEYNWVGNELYIYMFGKLSFFKFQHLATNGTSKFERLRPGGNFSTRILATLVIAVVQGKSLQSLDYFQCILAGKNTARFWFSCYPSSIYSSLSISHILQREFFSFGPFGQLRAVRKKSIWVFLS